MNPTPTNTDAARSVVPPLCLFSVLAAEYHVEQTRNCQTFHGGAPGIAKDPAMRRMT